MPGKSVSKIFLFARTPRLFLDTSVYITCLRQGVSPHDLYRFPPGVEIVTSAVVLMELKVGQRTVGEKAFIQRLQGNFPTVFPQPGGLLETGDILSRLSSLWRGKGPALLSLQNDCLIALTARDTRTTVVTLNGKDFKALARHIRFPMICL